ncbi:glycosyltransferase [Olleya sp. Bg11-27]|nr:glycosyltransferase [Olleya sp. Bg11-27]
MIKRNNKKVCIVVSSLAGGGAERSSGLLSIMLYDAGFDVHVVSVLNNIDFPYKGELLNLGLLKDKDDSVFGRWHRLRVFNSYLKQYNFDYVIDNRTRIGFVKEFIISKFLYTPRQTIYCVRNFKVNLYINSNKFLSKILYGNAYKMVGVSKGIYERLMEEYGFSNAIAIHNPVDKRSDVIKEVENDSLKEYILFFGRLDDEHKNVSLLIEGYAGSSLPEKGVKLKILGEGPDLEKLKLKAEDYGLSNNIEFLPYLVNPQDVITHALFTVLTSRYEGFPRSILESLSLGVPVVSVDCKSGPNEIIKNGCNGILVENHNPKKLADAISRLYENKELYLNCKNNSISSVVSFSEANIVQKWEAILN